MMTMTKNSKTVSAIFAAIIGASVVFATPGISENYGVQITPAVSYSTDDVSIVEAKTRVHRSFKRKRNFNRHRGFNRNFNRHHGFNRHHRSSRRFNNLDHLLYQQSLYSNQSSFNRGPYLAPPRFGIHRRF